jgi:hypothetical protein
MNIKKLFFFSLLSIGIIHIVVGEKSDSLSHNSKKNRYESCIVRPTFFEFSIRTLPAINFYPRRDIPEADDFNRNKLYSFKLNIPLILSNKLDVIAQLRYKNEQLHLGEYDDAYKKKIHFDNAGLSLMYQYNFNGNFFLAGHFGGSFKSDKFNLEQYSSILDYSSSLLFGKNFDYGKLGIGAIFGNSLGRFRIYPLFLFDYEISDKWKLEVKLPKELKIRRILQPDNFYLIGGAEIRAASYFISEDILPDEKNLEYRRGAVELNIGIEKEISDFLWFGAELGITQPIYSALVKRGDPTRKKLFDFNHSFTPYGSVSIYIVPPSSLFNKIR